MHTLQLGLLKITNADGSQLVSQSVGDYIFELQTEYAGGWSDWLEVGGRWSDFFDQYNYLVWPNKIDVENYMLEVNYDNLDIVIAALRTAAGYQQDNFSWGQRRIADLAGLDFVTDLVDQSMTLEELDKKYPGRGWEISYNLKSLLQIADGEWTHESGFFWLRNSKFDNTNGSYPIIDTNATRLANDLEDPSTRDKRLEFLSGYYLIVTDFHH